LARPYHSADIPEDEEVDDLDRAERKALAGMLSSLTTLDSFVCYVLLS
jgi:hypothetical protein